ncbi:MAG TPA: outer membrane lipoprotein-sorting protein [Dongiaceae bacterium]|nr:outer membrane lipoprotein-sorting protein [Dongiaceae bacterium]
MRRIIPVYVATLVVPLLLVAAPVCRAQPTAREIVDRVDRMLRGASSRGDLVMEIATAHWTRSLEMRVWSLGTAYALVRVTAPPKEAGTATLKVNEEVWNYLPRVDRTIKVPPSLMMGSWMGSHFTNDDLVKESRMIDDYDIAIGFEGDRAGVAVWEFVLTPKPTAAVVWGRVVEQVRKADLMPTWARYYDERGNLARTMTFSDYRTFGARLVPAVTVVRPADKLDERTTIRYRQLEFDVPLQADFFSLRNLQERRQP